MSDERKLRVVQIACIAYVLVSFFVMARFAGPPSQVMSWPQWFFTVIGLHCAVVSFPLRSRVIRGPKQPGTEKLTPRKRWLAGNVIHLVYSTSVCIWVFVLQVLGRKPGLFVRCLP